MTEENYNYRTSQTMLRNQFTGTGKLQIPIIPKFQEKPGDFDDLLLIGFDKTHLEDQDHLNRMVHFFLYDYRFERVWKHPDHDLEKLSRYWAVLSPDFSMYLEMARCARSTMYFATAGAVPTGPRKACALSPRSTGGTNPPLSSALTVSNGAALWRFPPIWRLRTTTGRIRRTGFWPVTMRCCGGLSRKRSSATTPPSRRCRGRLYL